MQPTNKLQPTRRWQLTKRCQPTKRAAKEKTASKRRSWLIIAGKIITRAGISLRKAPEMPERRDISRWRTLFLWSSPSNMRKPSIHLWVEPSLYLIHTWASHILAMSLSAAMTSKRTTEDYTSGKCSRVIKTLVKTLARKPCSTSERCFWLVSIRATFRRTWCYNPHWASTTLQATRSWRISSTICMITNAQKDLGSPKPSASLSCATTVTTTLCAR